MAKYAERTTVSPEQRRGEIERTLARYRATPVRYPPSPHPAPVGFEMPGRPGRCPGGTRRPGRHVRLRPGDAAAVRARRSAPRPGAPAGHARHDPCPGSRLHLRWVRLGSLAHPDAGPAMNGWDQVHGPHGPPQARTGMYFRYAERGLAGGLPAGVIAGAPITMAPKNAR